MLPLNAIPTEVIRKSLVPYQGFVMPFEIALSPRDRSGLKYIHEPISRLEPAMQAELHIDPTPIFQVFVDLFGYDLAALHEGAGECGVPDHSWNLYGQPKRIPFVIRWQAFGGKATLCIGPINPFQYYIVAVADKAITPHLLKVLKALETLHQAKAQEFTEELSAGKVAVQTKVDLGYSPMEPQYLSGTFSVRERDLDSGIGDLLRQLEELRFSANWHKGSRSSKSSALLQLTWLRRLNGHTPHPRLTEFPPDLTLDFNVGDVIPGSLIDHIRQSSIDDAEAMMQVIMEPAFRTREEMTQQFLFEERLTYQRALIEPELAERQSLLRSIHYLSFQQLMVQLRLHSSGDIQPRMYFSRDFRLTPASQLVDTGPTQVFRYGRVEASEDILLYGLGLAYSLFTQLVEAEEHKARAVIKGEVIATSIVHAEHGEGNQTFAKAFELDLPYFTVHCGLPVRVNRTMIVWREGMTEALACDFYMDIYTPSILYAALRRVPVPKEWKEDKS